jgi:hypothetical protein
VDHKVCSNLCDPKVGLRACCKSMFYSCLFSHWSTVSFQQCPQWEGSELGLEGILVGNAGGCVFEQWEYSCHFSIKQLFNVCCKIYVYNISPTSEKSFWFRDCYSSCIVDLYLYLPTCTESFVDCTIMINIAACDDAVAIAKWSTHLLVERSYGFCYCYFFQP